MKSFYRGLVLLIIDFGLIWLLVYYLDPEPSVSIAIIYLVPFVFILNLLIAWALYMFKAKEFSRSFLVNSIIASILMYYLYDKGIARHQNRTLESWSFQCTDTTYNIIRWKHTNRFSVSYSLDPGSSWGILEGEYSKVDNGWNLISEKGTMKIENNILIGFRFHTDSIIMQKDRR